MRTVLPSPLDDRLAAPEFSQNPYPIYRALSSEHPVCWSDRWGCWLLTSHEAVSASFRDAAIFSSSHRFKGMFDELPTDVQTEIEPINSHFNSGKGLIHSDAPDHTRLRRLVHLVFTPRVVQKMREQVQRLVDQHLDAAAAQGMMDVVKDFAFPLPATVIMTMLGIPLEDMERLKGWSQDVLAFQATGRVSPETTRFSQRALLDMRAYLGQLVQQRRVVPQDDLITLMVQAESEGDKLNEDELLSTCVTLMVAGHETTTNLISNGLLLLLTHPDQMRELQQHLERMPTAVEELLRIESPIQRNRRRVTQDTAFYSQTLRANDTVMQMIGAANRDARLFEQPDTLDLGRTPNPHIAFGVGVHFCLGAALARLEGSIALTSLLERFPYMRRMTDQIEYHPGIMRALKSLPVSF